MIGLYRSLLFSQWHLHPAKKRVEKVVSFPHTRFSTKTIPAFMPLTDVKIRQAKAVDKTIKLTDSHGLYLEVKPNGSKLWRYRFRIAGKENLFAIGDYPTVNLQSARAKRDEARELVKQGINPAHRRQARKQEAVGQSRETFKAVAEEWFERMKPRWSDAHYTQVATVLRADAFPYIGANGMRSITAHQILDIVRRVDKRGAPTVAISLRTWISAVFRFAVSTLRADSDPSAVLRGSVVKPQVEHSRALSAHELRTIAEKTELHGHAATRFALKLMPLLFVRTVELRSAKWTNVDLEAREWRVPAEDMKSRRLHVVPLSSQAVKLLTQLKTLTGHKDYLFPSARKQSKEPHMSRATLNRALEVMLPDAAEPVTGHDFRATASTHLREMGWADHLIEMQLAHLDKNQTRAAYNHALYLPERHKMMQAWADWLEAAIKDL